MRVEPLQFSSWIAVLKNPILLCIMAVTLLSMSGQFTVVSYLAPILREAFAATPSGIALMFGIFGVAGVLGNYLATKAIGRFGVDRAILVALCFLLAGLGTFGVFFGNYTLGCIACFIWGLGTFSSNSMQQSRLVGIAPTLAAATVALNTSAVYLGQSVGAATGGFAIRGGISAGVPGWRLAFLLLLSHFRSPRRGLRRVSNQRLETG
jgi:predicted MFS family arabinose efflux permease